MSNLEKHPPPSPLPRKIPTVAVIVPGVTQDQELARGQQLAQNTIMAGENSLRRRWTEEETILALYLYFQLPYGKLHSGNPEIRELAEALDRPSNSIKMKLCNFASLDPKITESGRKGLAGASRQDREIYAEFGHKWSALVARAEALWALRVTSSEDKVNAPVAEMKANEFLFAPYQGASTTKASVNQRVGQNFFRRAVLANYEDRCCITGIAEPRLLVASHIKPWGKDAENRHNPANGLLLSATLDGAFDRGLITVTKNQKVLVSRHLRESQSQPTRDYFRQFEGATLRPALRFDPEPQFLEWHNENCFIDALAG